MEYKVYLNVKIVIIISLMFVMASYDIINGNHAITFYLFYTMILIFFLFSILYSFIPYLTYDTTGIRKKYYLIAKYKRNYLWKNVERIESRSTIYGTTIYFVDENNKTSNVVYLTSFGNRKYFKVLTDIVKYVQRDNPRAKIDKLTFDRIKNPPRFYF